MQIDPSDTVFLSIDIQPRQRTPWTAEKRLEVFKREAFTLEELNQAVDHFFDVMLPNAVRVAEFARERKIPRFFVHWAAGTAGLRDDEARPHDSFHVKPADRIIPKIEMDAFPSSTIGPELKKLGRKTLIMVGGHSRGCLGETAKSALKAGYRCIAIRDATFDCSYARWPLGLAEVPYHSVVDTEAFIRVNGT